MDETHFVDQKQKSSALNIEPRRPVYRLRTEFHMKKKETSQVNIPFIGINGIGGAHHEQRP